MLIAFPLSLQTNIIAQMLSIGGEKPPEEGTLLLLCQLANASVLKMAITKKKQENGNCGT